MIFPSLKRGWLAWVYDRYPRPDSPLYSEQAEAKAARRGLWAEAAPVRPWEWRRSKTSMTPR